MDAAEVIMQGDGVAMVVDLLGQGVWRSSRGAGMRSGCKAEQHEPRMDAITDIVILSAAENLPSLDCRKEREILRRAQDDILLVIPAQREFLFSRAEND